MTIITQLVILTLLLLLVDADQYCHNLVKECRENFLNKCSAQNVTVKSCCDLKLFTAPSRVYRISKTVFDIANAYCDMTTDGGGWIVIQRSRKNSAENFNRSWTDYEVGFGDLNTDFWYGLEPIHCLTQRGQWEMRVDYQFINNTWSYLHYKNFSVGSASEEYPLTVGGFTGVGDDLFNSRGGGLHNGRKFSTPDKGRGCAFSYKSGWWYQGCYCININKQPPSVGCTTRANTLFTEMKIRPKDCITQ